MNSLMTPRQMREFRQEHRDFALDFLAQAIEEANKAIERINRHQYEDAYSLAEDVKADGHMALFHLRELLP